MSKLDRILQLSIVIMVVGMVYVIASTLHERVVVAGDNAPKFSVTTEDGRTMTARDFGGKILVLNFWATWCPPCVEETPSLNALHKELGDEGVVVLGVSVDKNDAVYRRFVQAHGISFPTARDPEAKIPSQYGTYKYPETYIIDGRGRVVQKVIGATNWMDPVIVQQIRAYL
jgi:cytochrome c biogenesis protein CcmG, thiol:disulfide interchange protein DsbE